MSATPEAPPRVAYRVREVAEATGIPADTVYRLIKRGEIPRLPLGELVLVPAWALASWAATGRWDDPAWRPTPPAAEAAS